MRKFIRSYFGISQTETNAFIILIPLLLLLISLPSAFKYYLRSLPQETDPREQEIFEKWVAESKAKIPPPKTKVEDAKFNFDPNLISKDGLMQLGFPEKIATRICKYREHGGVFHEKKDLLKIYGISEEHVNFLWSYIDIKETTSKEIVSGKKIKPQYSKQKKEEIIFRTDLNRATAEDLITIKGIGPVLSERIIKYRNSLGGFRSLSQLMEVYGLKLDVVERLESRFEVNPELVTKIDLNDENVNNLSRHPYISYSLAKVIRSYKEQHGHFKELEELKSIKIMNDSLYDRISPYLAIDPEEQGEQPKDL